MNKTDFLFVYGTLMKSVKSRMSVYLDQNSEFIGEGYFTGRLFDLGQYPGLIKDDQSPYQVLGHIFAIHNPAILKDLDIYEGNPTGFSEENEYVRRPIEVVCLGQTISCWAYFYNRSVQGLIEIYSGNYPAYCSANPKHQKFIQFP